jgi:cell division protein FtsW
MSSRVNQATLGKSDSTFSQLTGLLIAIGTVFIISASWHDGIFFHHDPWHFIIRHLIFVCLSVAIVYVFSFLHFRWLKFFAWHSIVLIIIMLLLTMKFGIVRGGARRWLDIGFIDLQVSEFAKIVVVLILTKAFTEKSKIWLALLSVAVTTLLILKQPDLGTSIVIAGASMFVIYAANINLALLSGLVAVGGVGVWQVIQHTPYQLARIKAWLDPYSDPQGQGYNLIQSQYAIGAGQLWGQGLGASLQKLGSLPISYADFIFSVICEEIGFLGAVGILLILMLWILRALQICFNSNELFAQVFGVGLTGLVAIQILINIGVATGLFPVTGMTLPFISYGGSSLLSSCITAGIVLNISRLKETEAIRKSASTASTNSAKKDTTSD